MAADASLLERIDGPGTCVVVDPIDGTHNYASGLALFGMIVAVVEHADFERHTGGRRGRGNEATFESRSAGREDRWCPADLTRARRSTAVAPRAAS